jgi:hypothetical protein
MRGKCYTRPYILLQEGGTNVTHTELQTTLTTDQQSLTTYFLCNQKVLRQIVL